MAGKIHAQSLRSNRAERSPRKTNKSLFSVAPENAASFAALRSKRMEQAAMPGFEARRRRPTSPRIRRARETTRTCAMASTRHELETVQQQARRLRLARCAQRTDHRDEEEFTSSTITLVGLQHHRCVERARGWADAPGSRPRTAPTESGARSLSSKSRIGACSVDAMVCTLRMKRRFDSESRGRRTCVNRQVVLRHRRRHCALDMSKPRQSRPPATSSKTAARACSWLRATVGRSARSCVP